MKRLTERLPNGVIRVNFIEAKENAVSRLAAIEDILGDEYDLDRLRELAQADREGRIQVKPKMLKCPRCGSTHLAQRVDGACYYCFDCGAHIVPNEVEATIATNKEEI